MKRLTVVAVTLVAAGCGGGGGGGSTAGVKQRVTLDLKGGTNTTASVCGSTHHYASFSRGSAIRFSGDVRPVPQARWKIKLKVKVCRGGSFVELAKVEATRDKHTGHFTGTIPATRPGHYFARASLYENGVAKLRSDKRHYLVR